MSQTNLRFEKKNHLIPIKNSNFAAQCEHFQLLTIICGGGIF